MTQSKSDQPVEQRPQVGCGVLVFKEGKILFGQRKNAHGEGQYGGPGGHFEHMESFEECVKREVMEESGLTIKNVRFLCLTNLTKYAPKHYVDLGFAADWESGEPQVLEPDKLERWDWYDIDAVPENLFGACAHYLEAYKTGKNFFEN